MPVPCSEKKENKRHFALSSFFGAIFLFLLFLGAFFCPASAKSINFAELGQIDILYNDKSGLPNSEANDILQTRDGFIWIASYSGLLRHDGNIFQRIGLSQKIFTGACLFEDSKGRLWVGTNDNGVARMENGEFTFFREDQGLASDVIRSICENRAGEIVVATTSGISYISSDGKIRNETDARIRDHYITHVYPLEDGGIVGVTKQGSFFHIDRERHVRTLFTNSFGYGEALCVLPSKEKKGHFWIGTTENLIIDFTLNDDGTFSLRDIGTGELSNINKIYQRENGELWLCADNGIGFFQGEDFTQVTSTAVNNSIDSMIEDYEGNLWFCSSRQGVMKATKSRFSNINASARLPQFVANAVVVWQDLLYIGTDSGLYIVKNDNEQVENNLSAMVAGIRVRGMYVDNSNNLWLCTYSSMGVIKCSPDGKVTTVTEANNLPSNRVRSIMQRGNGDMVTATRDGLAVIRNDTVIQTITSKEGLYNSEILTLCESSDGKTLYAGSDGGGIYVIREGKIQECISTKDGLGASVILRIKEDPRLGWLWILTGNSIACLRDGEIQTVKDFPTPSNYDIIFPEDGSLWILSSNGIYKTKAEDLLSDKIKYKFYGAREGLYGSITANSFSCLTDEGTLYLCVRNGISSISTKGKEQNKICRLSIPFLVVDGKTVYFNKNRHVQIDSSSQRISLKGYALTYSLNNPLLFSYLEGFNEKPVVVHKSEITESTYTNLPGGQYTFHFAVLDENTESRVAELTATIDKKLTLWEEPAFFVLVIFLFLCTLYGMFKLVLYTRTKALLAKQQEMSLFLDQIIRAFARTIDIKDKYTNGHSARVAKYSAAIAKAMNFSDEKVDSIFRIGMLHDVGKIVIPDEILRKCGPLTEQEYSIIQKHAQAGEEILKEITSFPDISIGAGFHHERIDGKGYNAGIRGKEIPLVARIIAVADTFDAMNSTRPYRKRMPIDAIIAELEQCSDSQLDSEIVAVFLKMLKDGKLNDEIY